MVSTACTAHNVPGPGSTHCLSQPAGLGFPAPGTGCPRVLRWRASPSEGGPGMQARAGTGGSRGSWGAGRPGVPAAPAGRPDDPGSTPRGAPASLQSESDTTLICRMHASHCEHHDCPERTNPLPDLLIAVMNSVAHPALAAAPSICLMAAALPK